ncbi:MAG TPA: acetylxylan esterase [Tepidisphaeraceae bacterium]|nr:acetylxylan esterase [Tepidisphaeraceae bacterium]
MVLVSSNVQAQKIREDFLKLIDRPRVPLTVKAQQQVGGEGQTAFRFTYMSAPETQVPGILIKPTGTTGRLPVVIALHGTGGKKEDQLPLLRQVVAKGFIGVAIDAPYHGERSLSGKGSTDYQNAILLAWQANEKPHEHPFFYDTVWDVMRLVDYLVARDDVDPTRIGLYGVSKGGIETYLTAAVDPRIATAVPCIGVESFKWALENDSWHSRIGTIQTAFDAAAREARVEKPDAKFVKQFYDRVVPGICEEFDGPSMVPLIAPRPLMTINGEIDPRTPMPGLQLCIEAAKKVYHAAGVDDHLLVRIQPKTGHKVNPDSQEAGVEWLVRWLKPQQPGH